ncbi:MAG: phosphoribosylamine--glycine ligase [Candidatus Omnitrophica bacterium]|nr:phosphoribosylamine--glycine ligase [Candidatus Omnitrophota bacterium]
MKVLVIGSGGREHALVWKIAQSRRVDKIFCAPGNGGTAGLAENIDIAADDINALLEFAGREGIELTVAGPEAPLAAGIADAFQNAGLRIFGPSQRAARLETSKIFAKELMAKYRIPTAAFEVFDDPAEAKSYVWQLNGGCVVKADGLAQGKGVVVANGPQEAEEAITAIMEQKVFGDAGNRVIVEERLAGQEASILVMTDSREIIALVSSQDHKPVFDGDAGPNTGGMGAYSPAPIVTPELFQEIMRTIVYRTIGGLRMQGIEYRGVLYAGIMITQDGPKTLEFNVRFGDPEIQAILPRLNSDIMEPLLAVSNGQLTKYRRSSGLSWSSSPCVCVVCASGGYPGPYEKGKEITGLEEAEKMKGVMVFHAGTTRRNITSAAGLAHDYKYRTVGGRVLGVTGTAPTIMEAIDTTYAAVRKIAFDGMHYRTDIGRKAVSL